MKALFLILLAVGIFGTAAYFSYELFLRPQKQLAEEKLLPPPPTPPDPTLPDFNRCLEVQKTGDLLATRTAFAAFLENTPHSSKADEAKDRLGEINTDLFLSTTPAPEKELYVVKSGDVLTRVAAKLKTTPELITRSNNLTGTMLRIGQKLMVTPPDFAVAINKKAKRVTLLNQGKFFKHYPIRSLPNQPAASAKSASTGAGKVTGKINDKIAWSAAGTRVIFSDKEYAGASHWVVSLKGNTLYSQPEANSDVKTTVPTEGGIGMAPEHMEELAVLLSKGNPVTID